MSHLADKMFPEICLLLVAVSPGLGRDYGNFPSPTITLEPTSSLALQGGVVVVKCETHSEDPKTVYLFHNNKVIYRVLPVTVSPVVYTIVNVTSQNTGYYRCLYENVSDRRQKSRPSTPVSLSILAGIKAPSTVLQLAPAEPFEGENFTMGCCTTASSQCFIFKRGHIQNEYLQIAEVKSNAIVTIANVTYSDTGNYSCRCLIDVNGKSVYTAQSDWLEVTVMGNIPSPTITLEPASNLAVQGGVVVVKCEAHTEDPIFIYLFQNNKIIYNFTSASSSPVVYTINNITSEHAGNYHCLYENISDQRQKSRPSAPVQLSILAGIKAPLSVLQLAPAEVFEGEKFTMSCRTSASSQCFIFKEGHKQNEHFQIAKGKSNTTVMIANVTYCEEGNYSCCCLIDVNGKSVYTAQSDWVEVTVVDRPKPKPTDEAVTKLNSSLILTIALASTTFIVLNLICAFLAACLSMKKAAVCHLPHHGEMELQDYNQ
ncbi:immunoglobulin superfamily member 1-like [Stegostoma tigrinum]|uniref:immunoglobulin superfamily member 1-like n=1 Tax=Stegostoma tigrinum TaxID=3053191 RepID=UPI00202B84B5|nr:immunoglobulin superfamily member 1-like [Stegostoma tigrinum]